MKRYNINSGWEFTKGDRRQAVTVDLPHVWDVRGGQGKTQCYHGRCSYRKHLTASSEWNGKDLYLEFGAVASVAEVYVNGNFAGEHKGGYSKFRTDITPWIVTGQDNVIEVAVDNSIREDVYPMAADYTFFGGIYRDVELLVVDACRFCLDDDGSDGIYLSPKVTGDHGILEIRALVDQPENSLIHYQLFDQDGSLLKDRTVCAGTELTQMEVEHVTLWNGREEGYLYLLCAELEENGRTVDRRRVYFGFRTIRLTADGGFQLNGRRFPLHGVSKHQDREDKGWALGFEDLKEDMELIREIGANSVRLAHYQHAPYTYYLCDTMGLVVWAEIPFISKISGSPEAFSNALQQMRELVKQNYNHPSICFWSLGNDVTMYGESEEIAAQMEELNRLVKALDPDRITVCAQMMTLAENSPFNHITDGVGYNVYYGWYTGECRDMEAWLGRLKSTELKFPCAIAEYGAEGILQYQNSSPTKGDYSEGYESLYHEQMLGILRDHEELWAAYVWNMFDFAAENRDEGGVTGRNNKGLVTYDRKTKKDAFYLYQAEWSRKPMVHIAGRRYQKRAESGTGIRVYSNAESVRLFVNGREIGTMCRDHHVFWLDGIVLEEGRNEIVARTERGDYDDVILYGEEQDEPSYVFRNKRIPNWFEAGEEFRERLGYFSVYDKLDEVLRHPDAKKAVADVAGITFLNHPLLALAGEFTLESIARKSGSMITVDKLRVLNERLNEIPKQP